MSDIKTGIAELQQAWPKVHWAPDEGLEGCIKGYVERVEVIDVWRSEEGPWMVWGAFGEGRRGPKAESPRDAVALWLAGHPVQAFIGGEG